MPDMNLFFSSFIFSRIPSLDTVIMMGENDFKGTYKFNEVISNGKDDHFQRVKELADELDSDNPINIQFTSVSKLSYYKFFVFHLV